MNNPSILLIFVFSIIDICFYIFLLSNFIINTKKNLISNFIFVLIVSSFITVLTLYDISPNIKLIVVPIFMLILSSFISDIKLYQRVFYIILHYLILISSEILVTLLVSNLIDATGDISQSGYAYLYLGLISKFIAFFILINVSELFLKKKFILPKPLNLIMILSLVLSIASMIFVYYSSMNMSGKNTGLVLFLAFLSTMLTSLGAMFIYYSANKFFISLQKEMVKNFYEKSHERYISSARKRNDEISKIWHDMGNHIKILEGMSGTDNSDYIKYVDSIKNKLKSIPNTINTKNKLVDIILNDKLSESMSKGIYFDAKAIVPPEINIDDTDFSSLLFNTIDNAIEACLNSDVDNKYIYIEMLPHDNFLSYKIKNSYSEDKQNLKRKVYHNKKKYIIPGYGLEIVNDIVEKYDGYMDINKDGGEYVLSIVLNLSEKEEGVIV